MVEKTHEAEETTLKPLEGITVVDLTHVLAGPYCTYQLALLGARVTKVESPRGDMVRSWGGTTEQVQGRYGTGYTAQNAGKQSVVLDITQTEGADLVRQLAQDADVFVENYRPGTMARHGLDYPTLAELNPNLVYVSISAFGQDGPEGHRPGFDDVVQATSGFMSINVRGDGPIRTGGPVLDYATGMHATSATLAALMLRQQTGTGQHVDLAMQDVTTLLMNRNAHIGATTGTPPPPADNRDGPLLGRFATSDGYVMLAGYLPSHCRSILAALELPQFAAMTARQLHENSEQVVAAVEEKLLQRTSAQWDAIFASAGAVAGGVRAIDALLAAGQPEAREMFTNLASDYGPLQVTNVGYKINQRTFAPKLPPPTLGQHSRQVMEGLGLTAEQIDELYARGITA